jgi:hypothetical protein
MCWIIEESTDPNCASENEEISVLIPLLFIISIKSSFAISDVSSKSNVKKDLSRGKRLFDISGKYLETYSFKLSKCTDKYNKML